MVNGRVNRGPPANDALRSVLSPYAERNQLFAGTGPGTFKDRSGFESALCGTANVARGLAVTDIDGDGAIDLVVTTIANRARVYRNVAPNRGHWILVRCIDPACGGRDMAPGVVVSAGGVRRVRRADPAVVSTPVPTRGHTLVWEPRLPWTRSKLLGRTAIGRSFPVVRLIGFSLSRS